MKLDHDIVREVLLFLEENLIYEDYDTKNPHKKNYYSRAELIAELCENKKYPNQEEIAYVIDQLYKEGYIELKSGPAKDNQGNYITYDINGISWKGHDLIDNIRSVTIWEKAKEKVAALGGSVSLGVLSSTAQHIAQELLRSVQ